jgi:aminopeptidase N
LFRGFSAPVNFNSGLSETDRLFLARHDSDPFNRWQALGDVSLNLLIEAVRGAPWSATAIEALSAAIAETIGAAGLDDAFKANVLVPPTESDLARTIGENVDPSRIHAVRVAFIEAIVGRIEGKLRATYDALSSAETYSPGARQAGRRELRNRALALLVYGSTAGAGLAARQYADATNMTDRFAALSSAVVAGTPQSAAMLEDFHVRLTADPLVYDKWLGLNAAPPADGTIDRIRAILADPAFPKNNPNRLRALVGSFASGNAVQFARADGTGFRFVTDFVADVDQRNPQVAARLLTAFRTFRTYEPTRRAAAEAALRALQNAGGLSRNAGDILGRILAG